MYAHCSISDLLKRLDTAQDGLSHSDAQDRILRYGFNELPKKQKSLLRMVLQQFRNVMVYILIGALVLSSVTPFFEHGPITLSSFLDAFVILAILILNALLGFVQEYKAEEAIEMLKKLTAPQTRVRRGGKEQIINSRDLVPGDVVVVEAGDRISADGRLIVVSHLRVNESSLTGESFAIDKNTEELEGELQITDQHNMLFAGTIVARGSGEYVVTSTGLFTEIGKIAKLVSEIKNTETPLQLKMKELGKLLGVVAVVLCLTVIAVGVFEGSSFLSILLVGVSLAVSAVPEGLPAVVTVCLAMGVRRMVKKNALVRRLDALETLGSVTVICSDKTGTITENRMSVTDTWVSDDKKETKSLLLQIGSSCNRAQLPHIGDPTEIGLLEAAARASVERLPIDAEEVPFSSELKYMQTHHGSVSFLKGAPEKIVELCTDVDAKSVMHKNDEFTTRGLRVLAGAVQEGKVIRFIGLIAMEDPPRATAAFSIAEAKKAGIRTMMITGDNLQTACAIARRVGIEGDAIEGKELDKLNTQQLRAHVRTISVYARVSPQHKLDILNALKDNGEIVAMSGDGVNDAPALKGAHVGIAMGKVGTDVAREAASIVLADDQFSTIVEAIREGRRIYDNIRKFVVFLLRANFDELLFVMTTLVLGMPLPYLPIHILWINLMTDGLPALALGMEKAESDIMERPPRDPNEHILANEKPRLIIAALLGCSVSFLFFLWNVSSGVPIEHTRTLVLTLAINFELFMVYSIRSRKNIWQIGIFSNPSLVGATAIPFCIQLILIFTPLRELLHLTPISFIEWIEIVAISMSGLIVFELLKLFPDDIVSV